jgi:hypothetical protein
LGSLLTAAIRAVPHDSLVRAITRIVARVGEPVIIFAEHRDALVPLLPVLSRMAQVEVLHGGCTPAERARTLAAFSGGHARVLLATDTAAEGLNLHQHCRFVVHLDTPWTVTRMAQREGRVDRRGQCRRVHAWRLCRRGHASDALRARHERRADAIAAALAPFGDVPVLLDDGRALEVPSLVRDAARATVAAIAARGGADPRPAAGGRRFAPSDRCAGHRPGDAAGSDARGRCHPRRQPSCRPASTSRDASWLCRSRAGSFATAPRTRRGGRGDCGRCGH